MFLEKEASLEVSQAVQTEIRLLQSAEQMEGIKNDSKDLFFGWVPIFGGKMATCFASIEINSFFCSLLELVIRGFFLFVTKLLRLTLPKILPAKKRPLQGAEDKSQPKWAPNLVENRVQYACWAHQNGFGWRKTLLGVTADNSELFFANEGCQKVEAPLGGFSSPWLSTSRGKKKIMNNFS